MFVLLPCAAAAPIQSADAGAQAAALAAPATLVDGRFRAVLSGTPTSFAPAAEGRLLVVSRSPVTGAEQLVRLNQDGSVDPSFQVASVRGDWIKVETDGRILVGSNHGGVVRLNADGSPDTSFATSASTGAGHVVLDEYRVLVMNVANNVLNLTRLNPDGSVDRSYPSTSVTIAPPPSNATSPSYADAVATRSPDGACLVAVAASVEGGTGHFGANGSVLLRLHPDGTLDPTFPFQTLPVCIVQMVATTDHITFISATNVFAPGWRFETGRLTATGEIDGGYVPVSWSTTFGYAGATLLSDGSAVVATNGLLRRYAPNGQLDPEFFADAVPVGGAINNVFAVGQAFYLAGAFTGIGGVMTPGLARLVPDMHASATRLTNMSARAAAGGGDANLILGFVVSGQGAKGMLFRGEGPALVAYGVASPMPDPNLTLLDDRGTAILSNDNWYDVAGADRIATQGAAVGAFPLTPGSTDAAAITSLPNGAFTVRIGGGAGIALAEGYDLDAPPASYATARVANLSARALTAPGDGALIVGFGISGPGIKRVFVRAVGPTLAAYGVQNVLRDPVLTVFNGGVAIATNDDWRGDPDVVAATAASGAFKLDPTAKDSAIVLTLPAGSYTAQVSSRDGSSGVALIEVYELR